MRILTRYILFDLIRVIVLTLVGMTVVIILGFVAKEAVEQGLGPTAVLRLLPYFVPVAMRFAVPGTVLLAVTSLYGRMASTNELVAVKSLGISPMALLWPMLILATIISFGTVWLNDIAVSWGRIGVQRVIVESLEEIVYGRLRSHRTFAASGMTITVRAVAGRELIQPTLSFRASKDGSPITVTAQTAELQANPEGGTVLLRLVDASYDSGDGRRGVWPGVFEHEISLDSLSSSKKKNQSPSNCPLALIPKAVEEEEQLIARSRHEMAAMFGYQWITGDLPGTSDSGFESRMSEVARAKATLAKLRAEPHRRWANGFCCLAFALVGAPIAIRRRQGEFLASFFACFLPILGLFYPMLFLGIHWAKSGDVPPVAVWTGNVVFAIWGIWMIRRMLRN